MPDSLSVLGPLVVDGEARVKIKTAHKGATPVKALSETASQMSG